MTGPHFLRARATRNQVVFVVCDAPPGACPHPPDFDGHRVYRWPVDSEGMTPAHMAQEVRLLERARRRRDPETPLPEEGTEV